MTTKTAESMKSVQFGEDVWEAAKIAALHERMTLRAWVERAIQQALKKDSQKR